MALQKKSVTVLTMNTVAFTVCFAVWMMYGALITFLVENRIYEFTKGEMGWLIGIPVLTGAIFRLPAGMLTDKYGGRPVFAILMLLAAGGCMLASIADGFAMFLIAGLVFGLAGTSFAVGIAYSAVWFETKHQGTALGIFGAGNAGAAITAMGAPAMLNNFTNFGAAPEGWRMLPQIYAGSLVVMTILFWLLTTNKKPEHGQERSMRERLAPLKKLRVWRFGLYYFLVFGGFVALAQWLIPYYVSVYGTTVVMAGLLSAIFTLPSGVIRALGGWLSDKFGARAVMYWVLGSTAIACALLIVPRMDIVSPGEGIMAARGGTVTAVTEDAIVVGEKEYALTARPAEEGVALSSLDADEGALIWPTTEFWHTPQVEVGDEVKKKQLLATGVTHIYFQANMWVFTFLVFVVGIAFGIGKAAVYKHIPEYFPDDVGTVGGIVGVVGGLGGFVLPVVFGNLLGWSGLWTMTWIILLAITLACLIWMHVVIRRMTKKHMGELVRNIEENELDIIEHDEAELEKRAAATGTTSEPAGAHS